MDCSDKATLSLIYADLEGLRKVLEDHTCMLRALCLSQQNRINESDKHLSGRLDNLENRYKETELQVDAIELTIQEGNVCAHVSEIQDLSKSVEANSDRLDAIGCRVVEISYKIETLEKFSPHIIVGRHEQ